MVIYDTRTFNSRKRLRRLMRKARRLNGGTMRVDASGWKTRLTTDLVLAYTSARKWSGSTLAEAARTRAISDPARTIAIEGERTLSYAQLLSQARRLHTAMHDLGWQAGDVVSFQLPNWLETLVINLAACIGGVGRLPTQSSSSHCPDRIQL